MELHQLYRKTFQDIYHSLNSYRPGVESVAHRDGPDSIREEVFIVMSNCIKQWASQKALAERVEELYETLKIAD